MKPSRTQEADGRIEPLIGLAAGGPDSPLRMSLGLSVVMFLRASYYSDGNYNIPPQYSYSAISP